MVSVSQDRRLHRNKLEKSAFGAATTSLSRFNDNPGLVPTWSTDGDNRAHNEAFRARGKYQMSSSAKVLEIKERVEAAAEAKRLKHTAKPEGAAKGTSVGSLRFPYEVMDGFAGEFAKTYSGYLESPREFFYMAALTCLGSFISNSVSIASEVNQQPRLYTLLLGESADDRKSTAIKKTIKFFQDTFNDFGVCHGVGSAEGLQKRLKDYPFLLLYLDEFKQFTSKCKIDSSVLLPA
jgi:hypothetical protein